MAAARAGGHLVLFVSVAIPCSRFPRDAIQDELSAAHLCWLVFVVVSTWTRLVGPNDGSRLTVRTVFDLAGWFDSAVRDARFRDLAGLADRPAFRLW